MDKSLIAALLLFPMTVWGQTHTLPGSNVVPSGASLTVNSGGSITAAAGSTVTGFGAPNTSGSSILYGNGSGGFSNVTVSTGLSFTGGTLTATGGASGANPTAKVGTSAVNGAAVTFMRSDGSPPIDQTIDLAMTAAQSETVSDAATATITDILTLNHNSNGTALASFGTGLLFNAEDSTTNNQNIGAIRTSWISPSHGSATSKMDFMVSASGLITRATLFNTGILDVLTGYTVGASATAGKLLQGDGTKFGPSTPTWPTTAGTQGYTIRSDGTNIGSYPQDMMNSSTASVTSSYNADTYLVGSSVNVAAGDFKAKGQYHCVFDMQKLGAGTGIPVITVRAGTAGTTSDTAIMTFTFGAGTGVTDLGVFDVWVVIRTTGASATSTGTCLGRHNLATTGIFSNAAVFTVTGAANASFNSTTATVMGLSFSGGTTFTGTNTFVQTTLVQ